MSRVLPYALDGGAGATARLGLILLSTDETLEVEAIRVIDRPGVTLLHSRIPAEAEVTPDALKTMERHLTTTASLLPQGLDAIGYGCTSGATVIGPARVAELVQRAHPKTPVSNPMSAVLAALAAVGARKIALVTPYVPSVTAPMRAVLAEAGVTTIAEGSFNQKDDWTVARISEASTLQAIIGIGQQPECEAVFASCTNLRSFGVIEAAEKALDKPVITSNQALLWHMLRLAGLNAFGWGPGRVFQF